MRRLDSLRRASVFEVEAMRITPGNIRYHELIGLEVEILSHPDPGVEGVRGVVSWETPRALEVDVGDGKRLLILKSRALFAFKIPGGGLVVVDGDSIMGSPAERAKRIVKG
ncbi:MAG: ribonuclease P protein subunit [Desulfurococcales archaeon]|nr:ribonuclease P protein subunit [Desulfurococcales archaeon]